MPASKKTSGLVIVESPTKEKTISRYLGGRFAVESCRGHVRDLPERKLGVDEANHFEPTYVVLPRVGKFLPDLKSQVQKASAVYLATDHDREGESIAWHLAELLELPPSKIKRITFTEITPEAIQEALKAPRAIDMDLVRAQQARRVIDRLLGYKLSPLLSKKIHRGLSAGRVQSVALRLLVERQEEIRRFKSQTFFRLGANLSKARQPPPFEARLVSWKGEKVETTETFSLFAEEYRVTRTIFVSRPTLERVAQEVRAGPFLVRSVDRKELRRQPYPPFSTSTLQQAASTRCGFPPDRTMRLAQALYEGVQLGKGEPLGLITYMRTDSLNVAESAQREARQFLKSSFGAAYLPASPPVYHTKARGAQEAHEAIRPTSALRTPQDVRKHLAPELFRLYELIWVRFVASQMAEAVYDTVGVQIESGQAELRASGRTLKFDGFLKVYDKPEQEAEEAPDSSALPDLVEGDRLDLKSLEVTEHQTSPPPAYSEASLIRAMEKNGIGRPSTYAPTVQTLLVRGYAVRDKSRRLVPTDLGGVVTDKLKGHFQDVMSLSYTAEVEDRLDQIAEGGLPWNRVVEEFYGPFKSALQTAQETMRAVEPEKSSELCPVCQSPMLLRTSRFGKYLSCSKFPDCKGKIPLSREGTKRVVEATGENCDLCGKPLVVRYGRRGKFVACSGYPACKNTYSLDEKGNKIQASRPVVTDVKCEKCQSAMWLRTGKRGHFLACSGFPRCRNIKSVSKEDAEKLKN